MSSSWNVKAIYDCIREQLAFTTGEEIEDGYLQLHLPNDEKLLYNQEKDFSDLVIEGNQIHFERLAFKLFDLMGNVIVKVHHYNL